MYMCVDVCMTLCKYVFVCVGAIYLKVCIRIEDGVRVPGTHITGSCEFQYGCWELNLILKN